MLPVFLKDLRRIIRFDSSRFERSKRKDLTRVSNDSFLSSSMLTKFSADVNISFLENPRDPRDFTLGNSSVQNNFLRNISY